MTLTNLEKAVWFLVNLLESSQKKLQINLLLEKIISYYLTVIQSFLWNFHGLIRARDRINRTFNFPTMYLSNLPKIGPIWSCLCFWKYVFTASMVNWRTCHNFYILWFSDIWDKLIKPSSHSVDIVCEEPLPGSWLLSSANSVSNASSQCICLLISYYKNCFTDSS